VKRRVAAMLVALAWLGACAKPVPPEHSAMVGEWEGEGMQLAISADGRLAYRRNKASGNVSIDAPIQEIGPNRFTAGLGPMSTEFKIDSAPRLENGAWTMTVDGVVLHRRDAGAPPQVER
jgi:hypothetical protein